MLKLDILVPGTPQEAMCSSQQRSSYLTLVPLCGISACAMSAIGPPPQVWPSGVWWTGQQESLGGATGGGGELSLVRPARPRR
jgi:hypothetical protein